MVRLECAYSIIPHFTYVLCFLSTHFVFVLWYHGQTQVNWIRLIRPVKMILWLGFENIIYAIQCFLSSSTLMHTIRPSTLKNLSTFYFYFYGLLLCFKDTLSFKNIAQACCIPFFKPNGLFVTSIFLNFYCGFRFWWFKCLPENR